MDIASIRTLNRRTAVLAAAATLLVAAACTGTPAPSATSTPALTTPATTTSNPTTASTPPASAASGSATGTAATSTATKVSANNATRAEVQAALAAAGVPNPANWAREVEEYRPYPTNDPTLAKLRQNLVKYNPAPGVVDAIVAVLSLP